MSSTGIWVHHVKGRYYVCGTPNRPRGISPAEIARCRIHYDCATREHAEAAARRLHRTRTATKGKK
ncbi:hypothetical protein [Corynebacterium heidelbergense]|uniref:Uncharacterized protein n=1 Tax=Corynebacterium heidelbergense TaxID=2055947 RepID=A0A364V9A9_9CORY|nr:hypothetical protein [Corynebacterium heidelbergense]RAV33207.1 hypothetical protein CWC39_09680 [Corynebacterium heidelbergense]WCZ36994.1 hypothetical protein CHEID_07305 [Corynebacterium heidelbergense]